MPAVVADGSTAAPFTLPPEDARIARFAASALALAPDLQTTRIGLAVSGGPDSLALLLLAWRAFPGRVSVATVDHGLRAEAAEEARLVGSICAVLGVRHDTLRPTSPIRGNIQSAARAARYALMEQWCADAGLLVLATAHHADDQAETVMMRLLRGSGVSGLAGIRASSRLASGVQLIRPLIGWRRSELAAIVEDARLTPASDPSNRDPRFDRVRMRERLASAGWIDPIALAKSAAALADAEAALDWATSAAWLEHVTIGAGEVTMAPGTLPAEINRRLVFRALACFCGAALPRGEQVQALVDAMHRGETRTLAGVKCSGGSVWTFAPAPPRRGN